MASYTKTVTDANTFFGGENHIQANTWIGYTLTERTAAFATAKRELEVYLRRDLYDPSSDDRYRDDYAHYEQCLFILEETRRTRESETGAQLVETVDSEQRDKYHGVTIAPMAMRYFAIPRVRIVRG